MTLNWYSHLPCLTLSIKKTVRRTSQQVHWLCRWERHLAGFPHLDVLDSWLATPKRARVASDGHDKPFCTTTMGVARGGGTGTMPPQSILDKNKDLGNYDKHLPMRDCFLAVLLISGLTK